MGVMEYDTTGHHPFRFPTCSRVFAGLALLGVALMLGGLAWDGVVHRADPGLAATEGALSPSNPSHLLIGVGLVLAALGAAGSAATVLTRPRPGGRWMGTTAAGVATALAAGTAAWAASAGGHAHTQPAGHADPVPHVTPSPTEPDQPDEGTAAAPHPRHGAHGHRDHEAAWREASAEERAAAAKLAADSKAGTARYQDVEVAVAEGYRRNPGASARLAHYRNGANHRDGAVLDPDRPEALVYLSTPDGRTTLVGVVYKATRGEQALDVGGPITMWHSHPGLGQKCYPEVDADCRGDVQMMHVWTFAGVVHPFADTFREAAGR